MENEFKKMAKDFIVCVMGMGVDRFLSSVDSQPTKTFSNSITFHSIVEFVTKTENNQEVFLSVVAKELSGMGFTSKDVETQVGGLAFVFKKYKKECALVLEKYKTRDSFLDDTENSMAKYLTK